MIDWLGILGLGVAIATPLAGIVYSQFRALTMSIRTSDDTLRKLIADSRTANEHDLEKQTVVMREIVTSRMDALGERIRDSEARTERRFDELRAQVGGLEQRIRDTEIVTASLRGVAQVPGVPRR